MEGGAVRSLGATDRSEGERGVGKKSSERDDQGIHLGERGKGCEGVCGSEPVEARESGDLGTDCRYEVLSMLSAVSPFIITDECGVPLA